jgi:hypothetical protein
MCRMPLSYACRRGHATCMEEVGRVTPYLSALLRSFTWDGRHWDPSYVYVPAAREVDLGLGQWSPRLPQRKLPRLEHISVGVRIIAPLARIWAVVIHDSHDPVRGWPRSCFDRPSSMATTCPSLMLLPVVREHDRLEVGMAIVEGACGDSHVWLLGFQRSCRTVPWILALDSNRLWHWSWRMSPTTVALIPCKRRTGCANGEQTLCRY